MDFLYKTDDIEDTFRGYFVGPEILPHSTKTLIAKFPKIADNDGYEVEVYCFAVPAQFFEIVALDSKNSIDEIKKGFTLVTGTVCVEEVYKIAKLLNDGMLGLKDMKPFLSKNDTNS
jgi:hypothetical protein